ASWMATGGRVLTYFAKYLGDPKATILMVGYQAEGTRGRSLLDGASEIKLYGKYFQVRAQVKSIDGLSGHADQRELINWLGKIKGKPEQIFITHAEKEGAKGLKAKIKEVYGWDCNIPQLNEKAQI